MAWIGAAVIQALRVRCLAGLAALTAPLVLVGVLLSLDGFRRPMGVLPNGGIAALPAGSRPLQHQAAVAGWIERALVDTFFFSHEDLGRVERRLPVWFTQSGAESVRRALGAGGYYDVLRSGRGYLNLVLNHAPIKVAGRGRWQTWQVAGRLSVRNARGEQAQGVVVTVTVRGGEDLNERSSGLAIHALRLG